MRYIPLPVLLPVLITTLFAQNTAVAGNTETTATATTASGTTRLEDVTVEATRVEESLYEIPASVGQVDKTDLQLGRQQLGIDEALNKVPGIFMQNRYNLNQDLSISIRGFGIADFGIRGVKIFVDGIPATTPDGQGAVDNIDINSAESIEVIRGPASALYGTAAGGVINITTESGPPTPYVEGRVNLGSHDFYDTKLKTGGQKGNLSYLMSLSRTDYDGYRRTQAQLERNIFNSKFEYDFDETSSLTVTANVLDKPISEDPGGLTRQQYDTDRRQAQPFNIAFDAEETTDQQSFGLVYKKRFNSNHQTTARNYYVFREFEGKFPFGSAIFERFFVGGGLQHTYSDSFFGHNNRLTVGFDIESQMDDRKSKTNPFGPNAGTLGADTSKQEENVSNWAIYLQNKFALTNSLDLSFGLRYDEIEFDFNDQFLADGDDSGNLKFEELSPQVGLLWKAHEAVNLYGTISTSFETPSTTEFVPTTGAGGFNSALSPQTATNYEIGVKGVLAGRASYQVSLFTMNVSDEILPAGINASGNTFFSNAGESSRDGIETAFTYRFMPGLDLTMSYTYSDFEFESFVNPVAGANFTGNKIPGVPVHFGYAELAYYHPSGWYGVLDTRVVDEVIVNNANSDAAEAYAVANIRTGYTAYLGDNELDLFLGLNNITDAEYVGAVRVNEGNSRFFEPAPEFNVYAGISFTYR